MARFLVDEDMPRSTAVMLREFGHAADDVRDVGLRGRKDADVFAFAQQNHAVIVTGDVGFGNVLMYPLGQHAGIMVLRVPNEMPIEQMHRELRRAMTDIDPNDLDGVLVVIEPGRTRVRRAASSG